MEYFLPELNTSSDLGLEYSRKDILSLMYPYTLDLCARAAEIGLDPLEVLIKRNFTDEVTKKEILDTLQAVAKKEYVIKIYSKDLAKAITIIEDSFPGEKVSLSITVKSSRISSYTFERPDTHFPRVLPAPVWMLPEQMLNWSEFQPSDFGIFVLDTGAASLVLDDVMKPIRLYQPDELRTIQISQLSKMGLSPKLCKITNSFKQNQNKTRKPNARKQH